jgi:hypothetical protein
VDLGEVLLGVFGVRLDGLAALHPIGGADLAILFGELEGVDQTEGLVDRAANGQVIDGDLYIKIRTASFPPD